MWWRTHLKTVENNDVTTKKNVNFVIAYKELEIT